MGVYEADPAELARRSRVLEEVAKGVQAVFDEHNTRVERLGDVWGTDEMGQQFASKYVVSSKEFQEYSQDLTLGVRTSVDEVVHTAERIQVTEEHNKVRR